jgi:hypothetical protein
MNCAFLILADFDGFDQAGLRERKASVCRTSITYAAAFTCPHIVNVGQYRQAGLGTHLFKKAQPLIDSKAAK